MTAAVVNGPERGDGWGRVAWSVAALVALCYALVVWQTAARVWDARIDTLAASGSHQLNLYVTHLRGQLEKFEYLPALVASDDRLLTLLSGSYSADQLEEMNRYLERINLVTGASDTYLMDSDGLTIAASNWDQAQPFIGRNFGYRPYFRQAMQGRLGRYFALGATSGRRGYYFAYPVRDQGRVRGAVVVKVDLGQVETDWGGLDGEVIVTDPDDIVFVTTRAAWRYRSFGPLTDETRARIEASRRYPRTDVLDLPVETVEQGDDRARILSIVDSVEAGSRGGSTRYLAQTQAMPEAGWNVQLLTPLGVVRRQVVEAVIIATAVFLALLFLGVGLLQGHQRRVALRRCDEQARDTLQRAHEELEQRVKERTADLRRSNGRLMREIEERRGTEAQLRRTQGELVQTAKLATLGQMAAGINHELNQPLAAIRSYADNGRGLLDMERYQEARWNLEQISELTARMARIGSQLRIFSRRSSGQIGAVAVQAVIDAAKAIVAPRAKRSGVHIGVEAPATPVMVRADEVLLQQVLVNLAGNAIQAVDGEVDRQVRICTAEVGEQVSLVVEDNGPGIADENLERIFDPFFTTKEASEGLGLGLTISERIIRELQGSLIAGNGELGGARFEIRLPATGSDPGSDPGAESPTPTADSGQDQPTAS